MQVRFVDREPIEFTERHHKSALVMEIEAPLMPEDACLVLSERPDIRAARERGDGIGVELIPAVRPGLPWQDEVAEYVRDYIAPRHTQLLGG